MNKFIVAESFTHHIPTGLGYIEGLTQLGYEAYALPTGQYKLTDLAQDVDCVVIMGWPNVGEVIEFKQHNPTTKIVVVCFGWSDIVDKLADYVHAWVEHTYKHDKVDEIYKQHGHTLHHVPLGASSTSFYPMNYRSEYDLSFVGQFGQNGHGYRHEDVYLYPLMRKNLTGFYSGFHQYSTVSHSSLNLIYNKTKINLNFHYWDQKQQTEDLQTKIDFNGRVFEIALSGGFQLCDHPHVSSFFGEGIVVATEHDWCDAFDYYLNNQEARQQMAAKAQEVALQNHTWMSRMKQLINIL